MFLLLNSELPQFCERLRAPDAIELFNTLSGLALAAPAIIGWSLLRRAGGRDVLALLIVGLAALLPLSQVVVHTLRPGWGGLIDQTPMGLFVAAVFIRLLQRDLGLSLLFALLNVLGYAVVVLMVRRILPFTPLADTAMVAPPVLLFLLVGGVLLGQGRDEEAHYAEPGGLRGAAPADKRRSGWLLIAAGLVLSLALIARLQDMPLCAAMPSGLHWLWHVGGAVVASLMVLAALGRSGK